MKRNPWPYAITLYFVVFISAMAAWICFAVRHDHELVRKDYYEQEIKFQSEIERVQRARGVDVTVLYDRIKNVVNFQLPSDASSAAVYFYRPSRATLDKEFALALVQGAQAIDVAGFESGLWKVRLSWKANGAEYRHDETLVLAPAKRSAL